MSATLPITEGRAGRSGQARAAGSEPAAVTFTMPVPPSVNELFRNVPGRGRVKTRVYDNWRAHALTVLRLQRVPRIEGCVLVVFGVERTSSRADIDNRVKGMLDAIVEAGIIGDDSQVTGFCAAWTPAANGLAHVQILPVGSIDFSFHPSPDGASGGVFISAPQPSGDDNGIVDF